MKGWEEESRLLESADETTRKVLGIDAYLKRMNPRSEAAVLVHNGLKTKTFLKPSRWRAEMLRLQDLDESIERERLLALGECLAQLPTLERPLRRLESGEILRDVDFFEIKRFLYHGTRLLEGAAGADQLPGVDSEIYAALMKLMETIHPEEEPSPRFFLADGLDSELAEARRALESLGRKKKKRRVNLEGKVTKKWAGKFDIHGRFWPEGEIIIDDDLLLPRDGHYELGDEILASYREAEAVSKSEVDRLEKEQRRRLTKCVESQIQRLQGMAKKLTQFDLRLARVELRRSLDGCWPNLVDDEWDSLFLSIEEGRDPLLLSALGGEAVQAIDLRLDKSATVVSGPNMGGKSALLRLVGLVQWCAQMALPVAAKSVKFSPVNRIVYVGSEQPNEVDINSGLSSFGREVRRFVEFWEKENPLLWLLDEPARGTHPQEGALLAKKVIDRRVSRGDRLLVATHFPELTTNSEYARLQLEGLEIDEESLRAEIEKSRIDGTSFQATLRRFMDYRVRPVEEGTVPRDASTIAEALGLELDD